MTNGKNTYLGNNIVKFEKEFYHKHPALCEYIKEQIEKEAEKATPAEIIKLLGIKQDEERKFLESLEKIWKKKQSLEDKAKYLGNFTLRAMKKDYIVGHVLAGNYVREIELETYEGKALSINNIVERIKPNFWDAREELTKKVTMETCCEFIKSFYTQLNEILKRQLKEQEGE